LGVELGSDHGKYFTKKRIFGNPTLQRWKITPAADLKVTLDFLIPPSLAADKGGELRHIQKDLAAVITPGLHLAFQDKQKVSLKGVTLLGEKASRNIWVCGPGAFVVLKALAFDQRGESKDAHDLYYVIRNYSSGVDDVCKCLSPLLKEVETKKALEILNRDFSQSDGVGPSRVSHFQYRGSNADLQADVAGFVKELLTRCGHAT
jgi:hypothetical protein